jgi:hypothetical protein
MTPGSCLPSTSAKPPSAEDAEFMLLDKGWIKIDEWTSAEEI